MTERERREQGLPPSAAQLALYEGMQREADEYLATITAVATPAMESIMALAQSMQPTIRIMQEMAEAVTATTAHFEDIQETMRQATAFMTKPTVSLEVFSKSEPIVYVPKDERRTPELTEEQYKRIGVCIADEFIGRGAVLHIHTTTAQIDATYNRKTRTVSRIAGTSELTYTFDDKEINKRRELFELLADGKRLTGPELMNRLECPSMQATYKVIQGLNKDLGEALHLTMKFADGSDRGGYRVHDSIAVRIV